MVAKLNGFSSWNVAAKVKEPAEVLERSIRVRSHPEGGTPPVGHTKLVSVYEINMVDALPEYDTPEETEAWTWVENLASFSHKENGTGQGIWEFMVLADKVPKDFANVPAVLHKVLREGLASKAKWLMFYQW